MDCKSLHTFNENQAKLQCLPSCCPTRKVRNLSRRQWNFYCPWFMSSMAFLMRGSGVSLKNSAGNYIHFLFFSVVLFPCEIMSALSHLQSPFVLLNLLTILIVQHLLSKHGK